MLLNITFKENVKKINSITFGENEKKIELDFGEGYGGATNKYDGEYDVTPKVVAQTLPTARKLMQKDLVIEPIPYAEVSNAFNGQTVTIG